MSICTAAQAVTAMQYWVGYYEKASSKYVSRRDTAVFTLDKGSNNYTYAGYICGLNGPAAAWCAMQVSTSLYEACRNSKADAKTVMHGIWPYSACDQIYDAAPAAYKGRRGSWTPAPGDVIVFYVMQNGKIVRTHTGMVEKVDSTYVYTIEGNKSNMCKRCTYKLTDTSIYGYVRPKYSDSSTSSGSTSSTVKKISCKVDATILKPGMSGTGVKALQGALNALGYDCGSPDGDYGTKTAAAVKKFQTDKGLEPVDGEAGADTLAKLLEV